ncbi:hypothetical protein H6F43_12410 [Leptolyngbya sp. FACHB-36]|uniref:hypothetical protein n=1 Tax=Leptolyngbya sp. FACHB-36 TaxID=2692808 RepID=UPI001681305F|nr:hypothetical protein [Leptolyngbya sp. FACHB-36]MBD2020982.1 hypothetical protein [Leptolyngbya sp. FACHB-36]
MRYPLSNQNAYTSCLTHSDFQNADLVLTPTGRLGAVQSSLWERHHHLLVQLDTGETYWFLTRIVQPAEQPSSGGERRQEESSAVDTSQAPLTVWELDTSQWSDAIALLGLLTDCS